MSRYRSVLIVFGSDTHFEERDRLRAKDMEECQGSILVHGNPVNGLKQKLSRESSNRKTFAGSNMIFRITRGWSSIFRGMVISLHAIG